MPGGSRREPSEVEVAVAKARVVRRRAPAAQDGAFGDSAGDVRLDLLAVRGGDQRAGLGVGVERSAERDLLGAPDDLVDEPSWSDCSTMRRAPAEQTWPECRNTAVSAKSTAVSKSASAKTTFGFFPPSSSATRLTVGAAAAIARVPERPAGERDHVDVRVLRQRRAGGGPAPRTRLATPAGSPASSSARISRTAVDGVSSLGLSTKVLPANRAGATFQIACSSG